MVIKIEGVNNQNDTTIYFHFFVGKGTYRKMPQTFLAFRACIPHFGHWPNEFAKSKTPYTM
jgi:hypothetical protein